MDQKIFWKRQKVCIHHALFSLVVSYGYYNLVPVCYHTLCNPWNICPSMLLLQTWSQLSQRIQCCKLHKYNKTLPSWKIFYNAIWVGKNIYIAISNNKIFSKYCDTQKFIVRNHYPSGYESLYYLIRSNHPNNLTLPICLIDAPPTKFKVRDMLSNYFHRYKDYI